MTSTTTEELHARMMRNEASDAEEVEYWERELGPEAEQVRAGIERGLCAVCLAPVSKCDSKSCQYEGSNAALGRATVARPTDRQLAFVVELLDCADPLVTSLNPMHDESEASRDAVHAWLQSLVPAETVERVQTDIDSCRACRTPLTWVGGNMVCPACAETNSAADNAEDLTDLYDYRQLLAAMGKHIGRCRWIDAKGGAIAAVPAEPDAEAYNQLAGAIGLAQAGGPALSEKERTILLSAHDRELFVYAYKLELDVLRRRDTPTTAVGVAVATVTVATEGTSPTVAEVYDSGLAKKAAGISAKAAAREAMARGADPLIVVDAALPAVARFRELVGQSAKYVAQDPLAALVVELRHKRVPAQFARAVRGLAVAADADCEALYNYSDGHERREGDSSVIELIDLIDLAALEGTRDELAEKAITFAEHFAGRLVGWREQIAYDREGSDLADSAIHAEIDSAADAFISELTKAGAP